MQRPLLVPVAPPPTQPTLCPCARREGLHRPVAFSTQATTRVSSRGRTAGVGIPAAKMRSPRGTPPPGKVCLKEINQDARGSGGTPSRPRPSARGFGGAAAFWPPPCSRPRPPSSCGETRPPPPPPGGREGAAGARDWVGAGRAERRDAKQAPETAGRAGGCARGSSADPRPGWA